MGGRGRWISEFEASLVYRVCSRTARASQRNPVSKHQKKKKKKKRKEKEIDKTRPSSKGKCNFRRLDQAVMVNLEHKGRRNS